MNATPPEVTRTEARNNVGRDILKTLRNYGIDTVFGIPGTHNLEFYRHLPELGFRFVTTRHEQGAGYAADAWSLQKGLPGVVITTSGPGLLNALTAAATAYAESRPLIILAPGVPLGEEFADIGSLHETKDTRAAADAVVEWARRVETAAEAVEAVHDAVELFRTGRPRPVVIEVPLNILELAEEIAPSLLEARAPQAPAPLDEAAIESAIALLDGAQQPVILYGGGSLDAGDQLVALAERLDAPVVTTVNGRAAIPDSHPLSVGAALRMKAGHALVNDADVLLAIGTKVGEAELWWGPLAPTGKVIRVDRLESQLDKNLPVTVGIVGDAVLVVDRLLAGIADRSMGARIERGAARAALALELVLNEAAEWAPTETAISREIARALPRDVILSGDSSQICYYGTTNFVPLDVPKSFLHMPTYSTLGYGLPAAIGAKIAAPERTVVGVIGDGALMFSIQELLTAAEQDLDLVIVCVDNGGYREIEENQRDREIAPTAVRLQQPKWSMLAEALGGTGSRVELASDLAPAIERAIAAGGVQFVHVPFSLFEGKLAELATAHAH